MEWYGMGKANIGIVGLGTMGENLALNIHSKGFRVAVYNRTAEKTKEFMGKLSPTAEIVPCYEPAELVNSLEAPRILLFMVTAGEAVDEIIGQFSPLLAKDDILIDAGNSYFKDTERRAKEAADRGLRYLGIGVSGGEEGALKGPCIMAGGSEEAYGQAREIFDKIAAKTSSGICSAYLGPGGAGHFTKMVHNGIEYALMELIAEAYDVQATTLGLGGDKIRGNFSDWNSGDLQSYLVETAAKALAKKEEGSWKSVVEFILDKAQQKGTGKWASQTAMDLGVPTPTMDAGVSARNLSAMKEERKRAAQKFNLLNPLYQGDMKEFLEELREAVFCSYLVAFAQGFALLKAGSKEYGYNLALDEVARIWKGGCIIRAKMLNPIEGAFLAEANLDNILLSDGIVQLIKSHEGHWRHSVSMMKMLALPIPAASSALDYYDAYKRERLPANLIQAMRDIFGAHTYERIDKPGSFHTNWSQ
jgi:6-phosphogluconate dehydrogenase